MSVAATKEKPLVADGAPNRDFPSIHPTI